MASIKPFTQADRRPLSAPNRSREPIAFAAESDPKRRFSTINCRAAKGSFEHFVGEQLHQIMEGQCREAARSSELSCGDLVLWIRSEHSTDFYCKPSTDRRDNLLAHRGVGQPPPAGIEIVAHIFRLIGAWDHGGDRRVR